MKFKDNTIGLQSLKPQLVLALIIVDQVMKECGQEAVITSINDGTHSRTSLHHDGGGVDMRSWFFSTPETVLALCKLALGNNPDIDIILESDHFHMEYQPKQKD